MADRDHPMNYDPDRTRLRGDDETPRAQRYGRDDHLRDYGRSDYGRADNGRSEGRSFGGDDREEPGGTGAYSQGGSAWRTTSNRQSGGDGDVGGGYGQQGGYGSQWGKAGYGSIAQGSSYNTDGSGYGSGGNWAYGSRHHRSGQDQDRGDRFGGRDAYASDRDHVGEGGRQYGQGVGYGEAGSSRAGYGQNDFSRAGEGAYQGAYRRDQRQLTGETGMGYARGPFSVGARQNSALGGDEQSMYGKEQDFGRDAVAYGGAHDHDHEPHYRAWRDQQLAGHDRDYARWRDQQAKSYDEDYSRYRGERHSEFTKTFGDWRSKNADKDDAREATSTLTGRTAAGAEAQVQSVADGHQGHVKDSEVHKSDDTKTN